MLTRRVVIGGGAVAAGAAWSRPFAEASETATARKAFSISYTEAKWRKRLSERQFAILRQSGTERPFTSALLNEHRHGVFACAGCQRDLFSSDTKFESGTGWPSFWAPMAGAVDTESDTSFAMARTAVQCSRCGGHLGHVFNDGPKPTGLRYCMNGLAMTFRPTGA